MKEKSSFMSRDSGLNLPSAVPINWAALQPHLSRPFYAKALSPRKTVMLGE